MRGIRRCNSAHCGGRRRWNRDHNAAINIRQNLLLSMEHGTWYPRFSPHPPSGAAAAFNASSEASGGRKCTRRHHIAHGLPRGHAASQSAVWWLLAAPSSG